MNKKENPLIQQPWLYEFIYPEKSIDAAQACGKIINRYKPERLNMDILEVGCGIGRVLSYLANLKHNVTGIDISNEMIEYTLAAHPELNIILGDMQTFDINKKYDALICVGSTFTYNLTNNDIHTTLSNFRKHCKDDAILILGMLNASQFLSTEVFNERTEISINQGDFHGTAIARHFLDRRKQSFRRVRTWKIEGYEMPVLDDAEFRLIFPLEIEEYLKMNRFELIDMWDNRDLRDTDLSGRRLYLAARTL